MGDAPGLMQLMSRRCVFEREDTGRVLNFLHDAERVTHAFVHADIGNAVESLFGANFGIVLHIFDYRACQVCRVYQAPI